MLARYMLWPCVCLSICVSVTIRSDIKRLNMLSCKQCSMIAQDSSFLLAKILLKFQWVAHNKGIKYTWGKENVLLSTNNLQYLKHG